MSNTITVEKSRLIKTLNENKVKHAEKVAKAREVYRQKIIEELDKRLQEAKKGGDIDPGFLHRLPIPLDYTDEYERAIDQYEWELAPQIELTRQDFNRFVRDEWEWQQQFMASSAAYIGG